MLSSIENIVIIQTETYSCVYGNRHHRKYRDYYVEKIPCNMVMMNDDGEVDMIKSKSGLVDNGENNSTPGASPASMVPSPMLMISDHLKRFLKY